MVDGRGDRTLTARARVLVERVGSWRSQLIWRGFGLAIVAGFLHEYHWPVQLRFRSTPLDWSVFRAYVEGRPAAEHAFTVAGLALLALGGRVLTLAGLAIAACWYLWVSTTRPGLFPAVELPIFALLPALACAAYVMDRLRSEGRDAAGSGGIDATVVALVRVTMVTTMSFAVLHKLNSDFFDPQLSCTREFAGWIAEAWGRPGELVQGAASPLAVVATEITILLALLLWPPLGIAIASAFFLLLSLVGASRINVAMIAMTWAFLRDDDGALLRRHRRRILMTTAAVAAVAIGVSLAIYRIYVLPREVIAIVELVAIVSALAALTIIADRLRARRPAPAIDRGAAPYRALLAIAAALLIVNGLSPYLGLKYNYSFAMWSNLRADESRWNSWIVPPQVQLFPVRDRYVEVEHVDVIPRRVTFLPPQAVPVAQFVASLEALRAFAPVELSLAFRYRDEEHVFAHGLDDASLRAVLDTMKEDAATAMARGEPGDARPVVVREAVAQRSRPYDPPYQYRLEPAWYSPAAFRDVLEYVGRGGWNTDLEYRYGGERRAVTAALEDRDFVRWAASLPANNLFPDKLDTVGKQRCVH